MNTHARQMALVIGIFATTLACVGAASAQTRSGNMVVRAQVNADCQIVTRDLDFGIYDYNSNKSGTTTFDVRCTPGATASVRLSAGGSGNPQARRMTGSGASVLNYQVYKDAGHTNSINTEGEAFRLESAQSTGATVVYTLHGQIPSGQMVQAGGYTDTVVISVQF